MNLPDPLGTHREAARLVAALAAARGAGAGLLAVRGSAVEARESGDQLKTAVDRAAEGWAVGWLRAVSREPILAEEAYEDDPAVPDGPHWTVDALDGTRSFVEGFAGFCAQIAWIDPAGPAIGVIDEPLAGRTVAAIRGAGAWELRGETWRRLPLVAPTFPLRFVDSTRPGGAVGAWRAAVGGAWVECGGVGAKALRIAEGAADVYAKRFRHRRWDVAPAAVILGEVGARIGTFAGGSMAWFGPEILADSLLATPAGLWGEAVGRLGAPGAPP
jgi:3'-phosphoadenosine 5'-phosphosulfate (PAPS) 3'-phosphatase